MPQSFHYMSDVHLEFGLAKPMTIAGENLILAGDITLLRSLDPDKTDSSNRKLRERTRAFFDHVTTNFKRVFYLTGNHESYSFNIDLEDKYIKDYLPGSVVHLKNSSYEFDDGTVIMGCTLWTNMNNNNPDTMRVVGNGMNDFRIITKKDGQEVFTPIDAYNKHVESMDFLTKELEKYKDRKVVVATHHSPSQKGNNRDHMGGVLDYGYYSDLEGFIKEHPNIKYWVFGHTHIQTEFKIGKTKVVSNAKGYEGREHSAFTFDPDKYFKL